MITGRKVYSIYKNNGGLLIVINANRKKPIAKRNHNIQNIKNISRINCLMPLNLTPLIRLGNRPTNARYHYEKSFLLQPYICPGSNCDTTQFSEISDDTDVNFIGFDDHSNST